MRLTDSIANDSAEAPERPRLTLAAALVVSVACPGRD
jgi:hypothetical protein